MANVYFEIPDESIGRVLDAFEELYPIPTNTEDGTPTFNRAAWAKKKIRDYIKSVVRRAETKVASANVIATINVSDDIVVDV